MNKQNDKQKQPIGKTGRIIYRVLGFLFTTMGIIGILVPVWPTTVFLLLASAVFLKSSPTMYRWLHNNRILGPYLRAYRDKTGISMGYKVWTISILWLSIGASALFAIQVLWIRFMLFVIALAVTIHVATIKTRNPGEILEHSRLSGKESSQLASRNNPKSSPEGV